MNETIIPGPITSADPGMQNLLDRMWTALVTAPAPVVATPAPAAKVNVIATGIVHPGWGGAKYPSFME